MDPVGTHGLSCAMMAMPINAGYTGFQLRDQSGGLGNTRYKNERKGVGWVQHMNLDNSMATSDATPLWAIDPMRPLAEFGTGSR